MVWSDGASDGRRAVDVARVTLATVLLAAVAGSCSGDGSDGSSAPTGKNPTTTTVTGTTLRTGPPPDGPNVLLIVLDDLDAMTMPYWEAMPRTKARLADRGTTFTEAFASNPVCCPSRATILTGDYPHNTEIYDASPPDGGYEVFAAPAGGRERDTMATRLQDHGYQTAFIGKYLNGYEKDETGAVPPGWDRWFGLSRNFSEGYNFDANRDGTIVSYGADERDYLTDVLADVTAEELARTEADDERPFFLALFPSAPHADIDAAPRHAGHPFEDVEVPRGENFDEADVSDKSTWLREGQRRLTPSDLDDLTERYRKMMGSLYAVDELIDAALDQLEDQGELDDTLIVFTSDNGYNFGAHRLPHKMAPYEESLRIPLVMAGPGVPVGTNDDLVITNDFAPTILEAAGLPAGDLDGRDLLPLLADPATQWRDDFLVEYHGSYHPLNTVDTYEHMVELLPARQQQPLDERPLSFVPTYRALRTERFTFIEFYDGDVHEYELYDLEADPAQLDNLLADEAARTARADQIAELQARLDELSECAGASCRD